jgi:hypothetical protein
MIDGSHISQLLACERMLVWSEKHNCPMAQGCLKASIKYHERMLEEQLNEFIEQKGDE